MDARKLAVRDEKWNCSGGTPASAQRLRVGLVRRAPRASRRAAIELNPAFVERFYLCSYRLGSII